VEKTVYTVSRLNQDAHALLEQSFGLLWVEAEISNFVRAASGHYYLTLKDSRSQLRCAMFRGRNRYLDFEPENGQQVVVRGKLSIYQARGDYQLLAEHMELAGRGLLHKRYQETLEKLKQQGWFDPERKREIPESPETIGVVTSPAGAAIRDVITVLKRRYPMATVIIYPTPVQGSGATSQIVSAIEKCGQHGVADVLIVTRGGGSLEDLWCFNEEAVAAAILASPVPVVAGVGHETDVTIADLVADLRAPTPSAAAELVVPDMSEQHLYVQHLLLALLQKISQKGSAHESALKQLRNRLFAQHPKRVINNRQQRGDEIELRLRRAMHQLLRNRASELQRTETNLHQQTPLAGIERQQASMEQSILRIRNAMQKKLSTAASDWQSVSRALDAVSPLATLSRGYSIVRTADESVVTDAASVTEGDEVEAILEKGR